MICATRTGSQCASIRARREPQLEVGIVLGERRLELPRHRARQLAEVDLLGPQLERARLQPREVEQVDRQLAQPLDLLAHLIEEPPARLRVEVLVLEQLDEPAEREDRRAQLVRRGRDELLARRLELRELALHVVERDRQLPELVGRVDRDRVVEVAGRDLLGGQLEPLDPLATAPGRPGSRRRAPAAARSRPRRGSRGGRSRRCGRRRRPVDE